MRSLSLSILLSLLLLTPAALAHDITLTGTQNFSALDGSSADHDGAVNGVFTVDDGNLVVNGIVNCNDDGAGGNSACAMAFAVSGNMTVNAGGALYAENRTGGGNGGAITLTVGGGLALNGNAIVSSAAKSGSGNGGAITANISGGVTLLSGTTVDSGAGNGNAGAIAVNAGGAVSIDGNVLSGPSRTLLATRQTGEILSGAGSNQVGGTISITSTTFTEPAVLVGPNATIASQGEKNGAGPVTIEGCGVEIRGLVAAVSRKDSPATVVVRSGKNLLVDGRDLGGVGTRQGLVRADALQDGATNDGVDLFARGSVTVLGPTSAGTLFAVSSVPGAKGNKDDGGTIRVIALEGGASASGRAFVAGVDGKSTRGGAISIAAADDVNLDGATLVAVGDHSKPKKTAGGDIVARSYSGDVLWRNGVGDVRPVGSGASIPPADHGTITLTACGNVDTTGSSFPTNGVATGVFPVTQTGVCSPAAPSLPAGSPPLVTCNTPPVANDTAASTNEDTTVTVFLSGSDVDGDPITFSIVSGPSNGSLGAIIPTGPTTATVDYTPDPDYFGNDSFVFQANDGNGGTDNATASITIAPVNDPPSFLAGPTVNVLEDSGAQTIPWVTSISPGPANESGQTVTFIVTNDNNALFSVQPAVAPNGTLTFTPAANAYGSATITIVAQDNGGTANGGDDTSNPQTSSITVTPVNDEPSFTPGGNVTVNEDSGPYSAAWATGISAGPNEGSQTVAFNVSNDNNALFSAQPAISPSGVLTFTPAANVSGSATVTVFLTDDGGTANGGDDTSGSVTFTITVNSVNDEPTFTPGGNVSVLEDSGAYSATWATAISAGANESGQNLTFFVSNNNNALFSAQPAISSSGVLTFTPAADAFGTATVSVYLMDDGGTANGGDDTSSTVNFTITIDPVNDAPSFTPGGDVTVNEDSGAYSAMWATAISAGPANESGQTLTFNVSNSNNALFSAQPAIAPNGVLTFTPAPNAFGTATVTASLSDNGGTANGGVDTSTPVTFTITVNGINDPPTAGNDSWATFGNTEIRVDLAPGATPHVAATTGSGTGVLDNDADTAEGDPFAITSVVGCSDVTAPFDCTFGDGSVLSLNANGTFSFTPGPGVSSGSFQYVVTDMPSAGTPASATGTVTFTVNEMIWYVNGSAAPGGNGTSRAPFNDFASLNGPGGVGDVDAPGHYIFVHTSTVNDNIGMEANQRLLGEGVGLTVNSYTLVPAGTRPTVNGGAADTVSVSGVTGVEIAGLTLSSAGGNGIDVSGFASFPAGASIHDNVISAAAAEGIDVNAGSIAASVVSINNTSITSVGNGLDVSGGGAAVISYSNGTILSTTGSGIVMNGSGNLTISGLSNVTIDGNTAGNGISINTATFDAVPGGAFNTVAGGTISVGASGNPVSGTGVALNNVSGDYAIGTLNAFGTSGVTVNGSGLFTGAAGMRITSTGGAISGTAGVGLSVNNASIGAANLTLTSISSNNGANGISLTTTGTSGRLIVTGTGTAGSGGTIQNSTGNGIHVTNASGPSLSWMNVSSTGAHGIFGSAMSGLTLTSSQITNAGNGDNEHGMRLQNVSGTVTINGTTFNHAAEDLINIDNLNTDMILTVGSSSQFSHGAVLGPFAGNGIVITARGTSDFNVNVNNSTFTNVNLSAFQFGGDGTASGVDTINVTSNQFTVNTTGRASNVNVQARNTSNVTVNVLNNTMSGVGGGAINIGADESSVVAATVNGNIISNTPSNGILAANDDNSTLHIEVDGNQLSNIGSDGIQVANFGGVGVSDLDAVITNNTVNGHNMNPSTAFLAGISVFGFEDTACVVLRGNSVTGTTAFFFDYSLEELGGTMTLEEIPDTAATVADSTYILSINSGSSGNVDLVGTIDLTNGASCDRP